MANRAALSRKILLPLLVFQALCFVGNVTSYAIGARYWGEVEREAFSHQAFWVEIVGTHYASMIALAIISSLVCVFIIYQIWALCSKRLTTKLFLIQESILLFYGFMVSLFEILGATDSLSGRAGAFSSIIDFSLTFALLVAFSCSWIYSLIIFRRQKKQVLPLFKDDFVDAVDVPLPDYAESQAGSHVTAASQASPVAVVPSSSRHNDAASFVSQDSMRKDYEDTASMLPHESTRKTPRDFTTESR